MSGMASHYLLTYLHLQRTSNAR